MNQVATGMSEARSQQRRGKKTPTLASPGREAVEHEVFALHDDPPKRSSDVVKRPVPRSYRTEP
jgi:hypothetical protein